MTRTSRAFVLGAVLGAAVVWLWGRQIGEYVQETTRGVRMKAAEGVRAVEETAGKVLDRGGDALHRVDDFLQDTKTRFARHEHSRGAGMREERT